MATKTPWANLKSGAGPQSRDGDEVLVGWDIVRNKMVYRLNGGRLMMWPAVYRP